MVYRILQTHESSFVLRRGLGKFLLLDTKLGGQALNLRIQKIHISLKITDFQIFLRNVEFTFLEVLLDCGGLTFGGIEELLEILALGS